MVDPHAPILTECFSITLKQNEQVEVIALNDGKVTIEYRDENDPQELNPTKEWTLPAEKFACVVIKNGDDLLGDNDDTVVVQVYADEGFPAPTPKVYKKE